MNKLFYLLFLSFCFSCTTKRLLPSEKYLDYSKSDQKIYIISALPSKTARDYSQFMSALVVYSKLDSTVQLNAFSQFNDMNHNVISKNHFFSDSVNLYTNKKFPLMIDDNEVNSEFILALDRKYMEISFLQKETKEQSYSLIQFKKRNFSQLDSCEFINDTQTFDAMLSTLNSVDSCSISIHVIDEPNYLFSREPNSHYYLIELNIFDDTHACMYLKESGNGDINILYSTFKGNFSYEKHTFLSFGMNETPILTIDLTKNRTTEKYQIETGDIRNSENVQVGNYLIYRL